VVLDSPEPPKKTNKSNKGLDYAVHVEDGLSLAEGAPSFVIQEEARSGFFCSK